MIDALITVTSFIYPSDEVSEGTAGFSVVDLTDDKTVAKVSNELLTVTCVSCEVGLSFLSALMAGRIVSGVWFMAGAA